MPNKKIQIIWEKWEDPFDLPEEVVNDDFSFEEKQLAEEVAEELMGDAELYEILQRPVNVVFTQFGMMAMPEYSKPSKQFKFWSAHTNFEITENVFKLIESTDGVETLDAVTRYRLRLGVGKAFKDRDVMSKIQENIKALLKDGGGQPQEW